MVTTNDLCLVAGTFLFVLSLPSLVNALFERRASSLGALLSISGIALIGFALSQQSYMLDRIPGVFSRVFRYVMG